MSAKSSGHTPNVRQQKKAQFSAAATKNRKKHLFIIAGLAIVGLISYLAAGGSTGAPEAASVLVSGGGGDISIPLSDFASGQAKFFNYVTADKVPMRFFVIKSSDGIYRAALDACDVCYRGKRGYRQQGDDMVCQKCGQHFSSKLVNEVTGGCNPVALTRIVAGGNLLIKAADLEGLKTYF
jgi:uncharacterized membrane protein